MQLDDVKGFVFDVDGSLVHRSADFRSEPLPGAVAVIEAIRASGRPLVLFTNGSHLDPETFAAELRDDGLPVRDDELLTPVVSTISYLRHHLTDRPVMVFGSDEIKRRMEREGIPLIDTDEAEAVFVAHVPQVDLDELETAARAVINGAPLLTANYGPGYWGSNGLIFSRGAMTAAAIAKVTEVEPIVVGKPSDVAVEATTERLGVPSEQHAVIGDDLDMDIALGHLGGSTHDPRPQRDERLARPGRRARHEAPRRCDRRSRGDAAVAVSATDPADLGVTEALSMLGGGSLSSLELVEACLRRIAERDGTHSHEGDPGSINAWVRVYEEDAIAAAKRADEVPAGERPPLHGVPVGLKDVYRGGRQAADRLQPCLRGRPRTGQRGLGEIEGRGDDPAGAPPHPRVHGRGHHRPGRQPLGARSDGGRVERRLGGGARRPDDARGDRDGHGRLASDPLGDVRDLDDQADLRDDLVPRSGPAGAELRPRRTDGADARRLRHRCSSPITRSSGSPRPETPSLRGKRAGAVPAALDGRSGRRRRRRVRFRARGVPLARRRARRGAGAGGGARRRPAAISASCSRSWRPGTADSPTVATSIGRRFASGSKRGRGRAPRRSTTGRRRSSVARTPTPGSIGSPSTASTP